MEVRTKGEVWRFVVGLCLLTVCLAELSVLVVYTLFGREAFTFESAVISSIIVPIFITGPIAFYLAGTSKRLSLSQDHLKQLADTDSLTELFNRRAFFERAKPTLAQHAEANKHCALLVLDADHFKELNDSYGHAVGDRALENIAAVLRESFRETDLISRIGGEEFAVLLPGLDIETAKTLAERVLTGVTNSPVWSDGSIIEYSVSCGVADTSASYDLEALVTAADNAMYEAKQQGRNRVVLRHAVA